MIAGVDDERLPTNIADLPAAFVELCEIDDNSTDDNNVYLYVLRLMTPLLCSRSSHEHLPQLMAFCGRTWPRLQQLVVHREPRSLLLLSYWFALTTQIGQWWMIQRVKSECAAILHCLSQTQDPRIVRLLRFPTTFDHEDLSCIWQSFAESEDSSEGRAD